PSPCPLVRPGHRRVPSRAAPSVRGVRVRYPDRALPERLAAVSGIGQEPSVRRTRRLVLSVAAPGLALGARGCAHPYPVRTPELYQSSDGTNANLEQSGSVTAGVRNAVVVVDADGAATFSGSVANYTAEEITVELEGLVEGAVVFSTQVAVPAGDVVELGSGPDQQAVSIGELDVAPGELMDLGCPGTGSPPRSPCRSPTTRWATSSRAPPRSEPPAPAVVRAPRSPAPARSAPQGRIRRCRIRTCSPGPARSPGAPGSVGPARAWRAGAERAHAGSWCRRRSRRPRPGRSADRG